MKNDRGSSVAASVCGVLGILLIVVGVLLAYATRSLFDSRGFAERAAASLEDPRVAEFVAERIADTAIEASPDLVALKPVLVGAGRGMVGSAPFRAAVRRSARTAHKAIFSGGTEKLALNLQDLGDVLKSALATQPGVAEKIPPGLKAKLGSYQDLPAGEMALRLVRAGYRMRAATVLAFLLGTGLCAASVALARERRRALVRLGAALTLAALVFALVSRFGGDVLALFARSQDAAPVLAGLVDSFLKGLFRWAAVLGFAGLVLASASASLLERVPLADWLEDARRWLFAPQPLMRWRLARGLLGAAIGIVALAKPLPTATLATWLAGLLLMFAGLREAFIAALHLVPQMEAKAAEAMGGRTPPRGRSVALVSGLAVLLLAVAVGLFLRRDRELAPGTGITACNGAPELCDRRLDEVVFATAHNAMSGADNPRWMFPNQDAGIRRQLEDGVRGFLIDAHYGYPVGDRVKTDLGDEAASMAKYEAAVGQEGMAAALRIRDRLVGEKSADRDVYMCHGFCELGATRLIQTLREVREFLVANPGEILILVVQDEGVTPQDIERCFEESGLIDFVYRGPVTPPWPTLREMAESDQRVVVFAENDAAGVPWYHAAFEVIQETPYTFHSPAEFSNRPNRGGTAGSLLQMNHWIETTPSPKPSNAAIVNAYDFLLARARACGQERGRRVNLVAVDFYRTGDLVDVVRTLNGLSRRDTTAGAAP